MRNRGTGSRRTVPVARAPWALVLALLAPALLPAPVAAQSASDAAPSGKADAGGAPLYVTLSPNGNPNRTSSGTLRGDTAYRGTSRMPLRETMTLRSTDVTDRPPAPDDQVLAPAPATQPRTATTTIDLGEEDFGVDGNSGLIRTDAGTATRRARPNNQGTDPVDDPSSAPSGAAGTTSRPAAPLRTGSTGRVTPVAPRPEASAQSPRSATQPSPRDARADQRAEAEKEDDGYTALGLRTGSFTWMPAAEFAVGRSSNIAGKATALSGALLSAAPELIGKSDWSRHELQIEMRGSYTATPVDRDYDKPSGQILMRGRIDVSDEMRMDVKTGWSWERQSVSATDNPTETGVASNLQTRTASLGVTRDVGLVALTLRGDVERSDYSGGTTVTGEPLGSEIQNNTRLIGAVRATVGSTGSLRPFVELQASNRNYDQDLIAGSRRDGTGTAAKAGVVADLGPMLRGEMSTGWGSERADDRSLPSMSGWLLDGTLAWSPTRLTVVKVTAKTEFQPTTLFGSPGAVSRTVGIGIDQSLRRNLVATAAVSLTTKSYVGVTQDERDLILSTGLTYKVNRNLQTFVRGSWERFGSNLPNADYTTAVVMVGVRVQQ